MVSLQLSTWVNYKSSNCAQPCRISGIVSPLIVAAPLTVSVVSTSPAKESSVAVTPAMVIFFIIACGAGDVNLLPGGKAVEEPTATIGAGDGGSASGHLGKL